ncbi:S-protein homolog 5-like [Hibiscus syriacus]|uniref:S-protein homolog 5-like n=1 Tax=Hibiscus syriacus TaxID=106335 RepID=UPI001922FF2F|nr:S-protein homolog 5-like [Hibiscus syriacus]
MCYGYNAQTTAFLCILLLASLISETPFSHTESIVDRVFRWRYKVHILNGMPDNAMPLEIGCRSNEDDLGRHTLWKDQEIKFNFTAQWFKKTHNVCNFYWGFKAFRDVAVLDEVAESGQKGNCLWKAAPEGIYFSSDFQNWALTYGW